MYKIFGIAKKVFIVLLTSLVNASSDTKYVSLSNRECEVSIPAFYRKNKYSKVLNGDLYETYTGSSCGTSCEPNDGTF